MALIQVSLSDNTPDYLTLKWKYSFRDFLKLKFVIDSQQKLSAAIAADMRESDLLKQSNGIKNV